MARKAAGRKAAGRKAAPTVSLSEFAADQGKTLRTVQLWIQEGMPYRERSGERRIVRADANRWLLERVKEEAQKPEGDAPIEAVERARKLRAEADLKELELAERRRQLVPVADYDERLSAFVGGFAAVAAGQLARFERDIVAAADAPAARKVTDQIHTALMQGAQEYGDQLEASQAEAEAEPAAEATAA